MSFKVGGDASHGSHRVVVPMLPAISCDSTNVGGPANLVAITSVSDNIRLIGLNRCSLALIHFELDRKKSKRNSSGDEVSNENFFYSDTFNHFYAVRNGSDRIR